MEDEPSCFSLPQVDKVLHLVPSAAVGGEEGDEEDGEGGGEGDPGQLVHAGGRQQTLAELVRENTIIF